MDRDGVLYLAWNDLVGLTRTRGLPLADLEKRREHGLGWAMAGHALTPFEDIVENVWGPMDEARQVPDPDAVFMIPPKEDNPAIHVALCDSKMGDGEDWPACTRTFLRNALAALKEETGLQLVSAFEHEFLPQGDGFKARTPFSIAAAFDQHAFLTELTDVLKQTGLEPQTVEPEFGLGQFEVSSAPQTGVRGADVALMTREVIREVARRRGLHATLSPKPAHDMVGNGSHLHLSLADDGGRNVTFDPSGPMGLSETAVRFCAGILAHAEALVAITAPSPVSYYRLGPHHWSCGFRAIGTQNREAMLRIVPGLGSDADKRRRAFNVEYRPTDATASPYLTVGSLVHAGLDGIRRGLDLPQEATRDPADMTPEEQEAAGVVPLPESLDAALDALDADTALQSWVPPLLLETFVRIKRWESAFAKENDDAIVFSRYNETY